MSFLLVLSIVDEAIQSVGIEGAVYQRRRHGLNHLALIDSWHLCQTIIASRS